MRAGRKPLPTHLKLLKGTYNVTRANKNEPQPARGMPEPPDDLPPGVRNAWLEIGQQLDDAQILTAIDGKALRMLAELWCKYTDLVSRARELPVIVKGKDGVPVVSPVWKAQLMMEKQLLAYLTEFGMTPSSRARVNTRPPVDVEAEGWERF
jgi:P27 family predicted phage terminase small subunit